MMRAQGQVKTAIEAVATHIRESGLRPGDKLPSEMDFARSIGVSRPVVREALRSLSALRIVHQQAGKRAQVGAIDAQALTMLFEHGLDTDQLRVRDVYEVRRTLEMRIAALAAVNRTSSQADQLVGLAQEMEAHLHEPKSVMELDMAFHRLLGEASRNGIYRVLAQSLAGISQQFWPVGWRAREAQASQTRIIDIHNRLAKAVFARDPDAASTLMAEHFDDSVRTLDQAGIV